MITSAHSLLSFGVRGAAEVATRASLLPLGVCDFTVNVNAPWIGWASARITRHETT